MADTAAPAPRKRGRPRKEGGPKPKPVVLDSTGQPRKRGRPRKYPVEAPAQANQAGTGETKKRGRGRPKKSEGAQSATTTTKNGRKAANGAAATDAGGGAARTFAKGSYKLECEAIAEDWPDQAENMSMRIIGRGNDWYIAGFDLGILRGVMLLAPSTKELYQLVKLESKLVKVKVQQSERNGLDRRDRDEDEGENRDGVRDEENSQPPAKKLKKDSAYNSRRLSFKWRGEETGEGQVYSCGLDDENEGYLEFEDDDATKFVGFADFPVVGNCKFTGTKIPGLSGPGPRWTDYPLSAEEGGNVIRL